MPTAEQQTIQTLEIVKEEEIAAPIDVVFETILEQMGPYNETPDGGPLPMKLEPWPGGRWFRDFGGNTGHWWGNVQAFCPPMLLEICGPLFMSYPATSNVQYRLSEENGVTRLRFAHRAIGWTQEDITQDVQRGWNNVIKRVRESAQSRGDGSQRVRGQANAAAEEDSIAPIRMNESRGMAVVGHKGHFVAGGDPSIAKLWQGFAPNIGKIPGQVGNPAYGVCWMSIEDGMDYMAAVEVSGEHKVAPGFVEERIPAAIFAVFPHHGHISEIPKTMGRIHEWVVSNGFQLQLRNDVPNLIERYGSGFDPKTGSGDIELWVPVTKPQ